MPRRDDRSRMRGGIAVAIRGQPTTLASTDAMMRHRHAFSMKKRSAREARVRRPTARRAASSSRIRWARCTALHNGHMASTRNELARRLAALTGFAYRRRIRSAVATPATPTYFVPSDTLDRETAARAGIRRESDLFGGVVPHPFVATKTITHPLVDTPSRRRSAGRAEFPRRVAGCRAEGCSAFAKEDALAAGQHAPRAGPGAREARRRRRRPRPIRRRQCDRPRPARSKRSMPDAMSRSGVVVEQNL